MTARQIRSGRGWAVVCATIVLMVTTLTARADDDSRIAWHLARTPSLGPSQAIGGYAHGCLAGGLSLPLDGFPARTET